MDTFFYKSKKQQSKFRPNYYASGVLDINYAELYKNGIRCIAFDVDGTITKSGATTIKPADSKKLLSLLKAARIHRCILASNSERDLSMIISKLPGFTTVQPHTHAPKQFRPFYQSVVNSAHCQPEQIVMIGDRYVQDIVGAKRSGLRAVLIAMQPHHASNIDKLLFRDKWQYRLTRFFAKLHKS